MHTLSKNFMSQKFGRLVGHVRPLSTQHGSVVIESPENPGSPRQFDYSSDSLAIDFSSPETAEVILRTAIAHLHRGAQFDADGVRETLTLGLRPWIGDLCDVEPAGDTDHDVRERRKAGHPATDLVESGVQLQERQGKSAARSFLEDWKLPPSVIRRVLSSTKPRREVAGNMAKV
jgi:hypothetical protein